MDVSGAEALRLRLEQQRHWRLAAAVRDGRQPPIDPDSHALSELHQGERVYRPAAGRYVKRLIGGSWVRVETG
jgi:hypothetical protein